MNSLFARFPKAFRLHCRWFDREIHYCTQAPDRTARAKSGQKNARRLGAGKVAALVLLPPPGFRRRRNS
jgi:hypothetical protein